MHSLSWFETFVAAAIVFIALGFILFLLKVDDIWYCYKPPKVSRKIVEKVKFSNKKNKKRKRIRK